MTIATATPAPPRTERLEARLTAEQKRLLHETAAVQGRTLTDFVVGSLVETATRVLQDRDLVVLSEKDRQVFVQSLLAPPSRTKGRLARAVARFRRATK